MGFSPRRSSFISPWGPDFPGPEANFQHFCPCWDPPHLVPPRLGDLGGQGFSLESICHQELPPLVKVLPTSLTSQRFRTRLHRTLRCLPLTSCSWPTSCRCTSRIAHQKLPMVSPAYCLLAVWNSCGTGEPSKKQTPLAHVVPLSIMLLPKLEILTPPTLQSSPGAHRRLREE